MLEAKAAFVLPNARQKNHDKQTIPGKLHPAVIAHLAAIGSKGGKIGGKSKSPAKIAACRATAAKRKK